MSAPPSAPTRTRAPAMSVEDRRSAIVAAAVPLFLDGGLAVTTREVARAAGIAEGTVFRAFQDKEDLVEAVIAAALDPAPLEEALAAIDIALALPDRLAAAVDVLRERVTTYHKVVALVGAVPSGRFKPGGAPERLPNLEALLAPAADSLRVTPTEAAHLLRGMVVANVHPSFHPGPPRSSAEIVDLLLHGVTEAG
jgi:AcrR family transcriptional regulator